MRTSALLLSALPILLAACEGTGTYGGGSGSASGGYITELPEGVLAIAAPYQDLSAVKIDPVDGCYVYRYSGPVETTFLPLRTREGRPICSRAPEAATATG